MAWVQPKTDWRGGWTNGTYTGDYFNLTDYNRIKNNLQELRDIAVGLYPTFNITTGTDWTGYNTIPYPADINRLETNLETIKNNTYPFQIGVKKTYYGNVAAIDYAELNRLEVASLLIYNNLMGQDSGKRRLAFKIGTNPIGNRR